MRRTGVCGAAETLLVDRAAAATHLKPLVDHAARRRLRSARRRRRRAPPIARVKPATRRGLVDRISRRHHRRQGGRRRRRRDRPYRALRLAPHRRDRHRGRRPRRRNSCARSIRRSCCTTPRPNSPTAASSASAPRSASPPAACTRAAGRRRAAHQLQVPRARQRGRSGRDRASRPLTPASACACRPHAPGMRIGLFGGTFDPPHAGASRRLPAGDEAAQARPRLVAGDARQSAQGHARAGAARASASPPRARWRTIRASTSPASRRRSARDTPTRPSRYLRARCPGVRFVWIMGADNLRSFHRWQRWRGIAAAGADRGGRPARARASTPAPAPAGQALARCAHPGNGGDVLAATASRRPGFSCTGSSRRCRRPRLRAGGASWNRCQSATVWEIARTASRLKPLTGRAYLRGCPACAGASATKGKEPCQHLHSLGRRRHAPRTDLQARLTPRRSFAWSSPASTT